MSEKRFSWKTEKLQHSDDEVLIVVDNENKDWKGHILNIVDLLNEQQATISQLKKINKEIGDDLYNCRLNKNIISEKLKVWQDTLAEYDIYIIEDLRKSFELDVKISKEKNEKIKELEIKVLNLELKNEQLRQMIKGNVFERYREGSLADLKFKAIAYDDIVKVEMSYELEPRVIVYCKQGKKENIMSFCQMFIPFGVAYEIKEVVDDE